jgi:hypothetical protein
LGHAYALSGGRLRPIVLTEGGCRAEKGPSVNIGKFGVTSVSLGVRGANLTVGPHGRRATIGLPGSGLSYSVFE